MIISGVEVNSWTLFATTMFGIFLGGLGIGVGSEVGKYFVNKYVFKHLEKIDKIIINNKD